MITLRPYQTKCIEDIRNEFTKGNKHLIIQAPTGSGKTVIFSSLAKSVSEKGNKVLILTDRAELLTQAGGSIKRTGLNSFYIMAGCKVVSNAFNSYIAMSQTLRRRVNDKYWIEFLEHIDLLIIDECHKTEFDYIFELFKDKYILGFTATPKRSGKMRQLGLDYDKIIPTVSVKELINDSEKTIKWAQNKSEEIKEETCKIIHIAFEELHPHCDLNGRTYRLIMNWHRLRLGLPILIIKADWPKEDGMQKNYYRWFKDVGSDLTEYIKKNKI